MAIKVRATQLGYYGMQVRPAGEEFEIRDEEAFSKTWMQRVKSKPADREAELDEEPAPAAKGKRDREQDKSKL